MTRPKRGRALVYGKLAGLLLLLAMASLIFRPSTAPAMDEQPPRVRAYMYGSKATPEFCSSVRSLLYNGWEVTVIGGALDLSMVDTHDKMWHRSVGTAVGALEWVLEQDDADVLVSMDAYDVLAQAGPAETLAAFQAMQADAVYSAEKNCWPFSHWGNRTRAAGVCGRYPEAPAADLPRYINSGVLVAHAGFLKRYLSHLKTMLAHHKDDFAGPEWQFDTQGLVAFVYLGGAFDITLDYTSSIAKSLFMSDGDLELTEGHLWRDRLTGNIPTFLHSNGGKQPFYAYNGTLWFDVLPRQEIPRAARLLAPDGTEVDFQAVCSDPVLPAAVAAAAEPPAAASTCASCTAAPACMACRLPSTVDCKPPTTTGYYNFTLPESMLAQAVVYPGSHQRQAHLAAKLAAGQRIVMAALGGSITNGHGSSARDRTAYIPRVAAWLNAAFPPSSGATHTVVDATQQASPSEYISFCLDRHLPPAVDLVIVEFVVNNGLRTLEHEHVRSYERLLRRLLAMPGAPLVVPVMAWDGHPDHHNLSWHRTGEDQHGTLSLYYRLPWLSLRQMLTEPDGVGLEEVDPLQWLTSDRLHPNDLGHQHYAEMVIYFLRAAAATPPILHGNWSLPLPMLPDNEELFADHCLFVGSDPDLSGAILSSNGFSLFLGLYHSSSTPDSHLALRFNTSMPSGAVPVAGAENSTAVMLLMHKSRQSRGYAVVTCTGDCTCEPATFSTRLEEFGKQSHLEYILVTRGEACVLNVTAHRETDAPDDDEFLVGVRGAIVSTDAAMRPPMGLLWGERLQHMEVPGKAHYIPSLLV